MESVLKLYAAVLVVFVTISTGHSDLSCNGSPDFCDLRFDQFTFAGSNSAGSDFEGGPTKCNGMTPSPCVFRTQEVSIFQQLELGIRYLSLDVCSLPNNCNAASFGYVGSSRLLACVGDDEDQSFAGFVYGRTLENILEQINDWMMNNTNEVIGIHFTGNIPEQGRDSVAHDIVTLLEATWGSNLSGIEMNTFFSSNSNTWPTLREAVQTNQRIFVFMDAALNINGISRPWINPTPFSTLQPQSWNQTCTYIFNHTMRCNTSEELLIAVGLTLAVCIKNGQDSCNEILWDATEICYGLRSRENRTVNILLVNYADRGTNLTSVFGVVSILNERNVREFIDNVATTTSAMLTSSAMTSVSESITTGEFTSTANSLSRSTMSISLLVMSLLFSVISNHQLFVL